jgi:hypothetical protein
VRERPGPGCDRGHGTRLLAPPDGWVGLCRPHVPHQEAASLALRGCAPAIPGPATWAEARAETLTRWRAIQETLDQSAPEEVLRLLTSMFALCERSETLFQERDECATYRCQFCPLFYALGARPEDVGCHSMLEPLIQAVRVNDPASARAQVAEVIRTIEELALPEDGTPPVPRLLSTTGRTKGKQTQPTPRSNL